VALIVAGFSRKRDARARALVGTITAAVLLLVAGLVSEFFLHGRADLTRDRRFTLSGAAVASVETLPDNVTVRVVMSKRLPVRFAQARTRVVDVLREFQARSGGRIDLVFEDPGQDSARRVAAISLGLEEVLLQEETRDGLKAQKGFFGLALIYGENKEVFPVLQSLETFEYDLLVRLKRLTRGLRTIGVVDGSGAGAARFAQDFSLLKSRAEGIYRFTDSLERGVDLLLVAAPARLGEEEKRRVDRLLLSGTPVIFLAPGVEIDLSAGIEARPAENGYGDLLAHYGLGVRANLVAEPSRWERVRFGDAPFPVPYPYWITVPFEALNAVNPITASLPSVSFPWTSSIALDPSAQASARYEVLISTSEQAWEETADWMLYPRLLREYEAGPRAEFPLAVLATGSMTPFYTAGGAAPEPLPVRLLVVSNALFAADLYAEYIDNENNLHFMLNAFDQLALDSGLIHVRSRQLDETPLEETRVRRARAPLLWLNLLGAPALVLALALFLRLRRAAREKRNRA
jgi:ABC-2 type transport system permease protein